MRSPLRTLTLLAALSTTAVPAGAQVVSSSGPARGWVGFSLDVNTTSGRGPEHTVVTVADVIRGGPADQAGIRPGDIVVSVNGKSWQSQISSISLNLRPGDPVRMVVERDGRRREVHVTAGTRPMDVVVAPQTWSVTFRADSMVDRMFRAMDSLRIRLIRDDDGSLAVVETLTGPEGRPGMIRRVPGGNLRVRSGEPSRVITVSPSEPHAPETVTGLLTPGVRAPFSFFIFRGEKYDSLRTEMETLNQEIRELRSRQVNRTRELARNAEGGHIDRNDPELRQVEDALRSIDRRASELRATMEEASRREAEAQFNTVWTEWPSNAGQETRRAVEPELVRARPLAPYVLGQNRAAGAEVVDLRPELASYFQVDGGVLIVDVPEGTPAATAGLQPGDVVIRVDGRDVHSIVDLRDGLARAEKELPLTLVRKGNRIQVLLRR